MSISLEGCHITTRTISSAQMESVTKHTLICGISGTGKDMFGERYITQKVGKQKVIDLFSEERGEGMFYSKPNDSPALRGKLAWYSNNTIKPQGFKNEIVMFLGSGLKDTPKLPKNIKIITFKESDLTNDDIVDFLAYNESQRGLLDMVLYNNRHRKMTFSDVEAYLIRAKTLGTEEAEAMKGSHRMTIFTLLRRIATIKSSGIFYDGDTDKFHKFNFDEMVNDTETITTFSTLLLPKEEQRGLALGILTKKILEMRKTSKNRTPVLFYLREMSYFFRDNTPVYYNLLKEAINKILREGRDLQFTMVANTQLPQDLPDGIYKQFNKLVCHRIPDTRILLRKALIDFQTLRRVTTLGQGQAIVIASGQYKYPVFIPPTMHTKKSEGYDVFTYLAQQFGVEDYSNSTYIKLGIFSQDSDVVSPEEQQVSDNLIGW